MIGGSMMNSIELQRIIDEIAIPNPKEIRGNITLVEKAYGATITWQSSSPDVITDHELEEKKAGVVTRGEQDCKVTLTAKIAEGKSIEAVSFDVTVKKAAACITEEDYAGYLFGHFIGEENELSEQIYFAISEDGLHFKDMNNAKPVLISEIGECGVRDPYLYRSKEGDRFFLIATDLSIFHRGGWFKNEQNYYDASTTGSPYLVVWQSDDLVHWSEPKLIRVAPENAGMAWAPEMIYHDETGEYVIFFSSSIMNPETKYKAKPNAMYYVTTRDFVHFSDTKLFIDNQCDGDPAHKQREIIDTTLLKVGDTYYSASKDGDNEEANGGIRIMKTKNLLNADSWEIVLDLDELGLDVSDLGIDVLDNSTLEGPEFFQFNKRDWRNPDIPEYGLIADQYAIGAGYLPITITDLEDRKNEKASWKLLSKEEYSFDQLKKRHGTICRITQSELEYLKQEIGL